MIRAIEGGIEIEVKVVPGASRNKLVGRLGDALKLQVAAPPEKGKANQAVVALIADLFGVPPKQVVVVRGTTAPRKTIRIMGLSKQAAEDVLKRSE